MGDRGREDAGGEPRQAIAQLIGAEHRALLFGRRDFDTPGVDGDVLARAAKAQEKREHRHLKKLRLGIRKTQPHEGDGGSPIARPASRPGACPGGDAGTAGAPGRAAGAPDEFERVGKKRVGEQTDGGDRDLVVGQPQGEHVRYGQQRQSAAGAECQDRRGARLKVGFNGGARAARSAGTAAPSGWLMQRRYRRRRERRFGTSGPARKGRRAW